MENKKNWSFTFFLQDHAYDVASPRKLKQKVLNLEDRLTTAKKQTRNSQLREKRAKKSCKDYLNQLRELRLINEELEQKLEAFKGKPKKV